MKRTTTSQFIAKAKSIHGDKYDYSKVKYEKVLLKSVSLVLNMENFGKHQIVI